MLDFIISKIGMLLFALAVASVLIFFSLGMKEMFVAEQGREIAASIITQAKGLSEIDALCTSLRLTIPRYIDVYGSTETFSLSAINYTFKITKVPLVDGETNTIVFSMYKKQGKKEGKLFAVNSFNTTSEIRFVDSIWQIIGDTNLEWDPTSALSNVIYIVKNQEAGEEIIYFVRCGYDKTKAQPYQLCYDALDSLKTNKGVYCVPTKKDETDTTGP